MLRIKIGFDMLKRALKRSRLFVLFFMSRSRLGLRILFLANGAFDREFESATLGRLEALSSKYSNDMSNANVRRCIHRLEKGLFHPERRLPFGVGVLDELYAELRSMPIGNTWDDDELRWATSTLNAYASLCPSPKVSFCIEYLAKVSVSGASQGGGCDVSTTVEFDQLSRLVCGRESVRFFDGRMVERGLLERAVGLAKEAPSGCNRQPFSIVVLDKREDIDFVGGRAPGTAGFLDQIPALLVCVGHESSFRHYRDRHLVYTDSGLFLGHFVLVLESLGISSCILNWTPDWTKDRAVVRYLGYDLSKTVVCLLAVGYRREGAVSPVSVKKSNGVLLRYLHDGE